MWCKIQSKFRFGLTIFQIFNSCWYTLIPKKDHYDYWCIAWRYLANPSCLFVAYHSYFCNMISFLSNKSSRNNVTIMILIHYALWNWHAWKYHRSIYYNDMVFICFFEKMLYWGQLIKSIILRTHEIGTIWVLWRWKEPVISFLKVPLIIKTLPNL